MLVAKDLSQERQVIPLVTLHQCGRMVQPEATKQGLSNTLQSIYYSPYQIRVDYSWLHAYRESQYFPAGHKAALSSRRRDRTGGGNGIRQL